MTRERPDQLTITQEIDDPIRLFKKWHPLMCKIADKFGVYLPREYLREDLESELRTKLWELSLKFDPAKSSEMTWYMLPLERQAQRFVMVAARNGLTCVGDTTGDCSFTRIATYSGGSGQLDRNENDSPTLGTLADHRDGPVTEAERDDLGELVREALACLTERQRRAIRLHYGLGKDEPLSLSKVGKRMKCEKSTAGELVDLARERLRVELAGVRE